MSKRFRLTLGLCLVVATGSLLSSAAMSVRIRTARKSAPRLLATVPGRAATLVPNGQVLLTGGEGPNGILATALLLDPLTGVTHSIESNLVRARAWHTATVLPDGNILVVGGIGSDGEVVKQSEIFNPAALKFGAIETPGLTPRARHTATLLLNGGVLMAGGISQEKEFVDQLELWDARTRSLVPLPAVLLVPRRNHTANLLPNGDVLFWGGLDRSSNPISFGEVFEFATQSIRMQFHPRESQLSDSSARITLSIPEDRAVAVPLDTTIAVLFSHPMRMQTVNSSAATIIGPSGKIAANVVSAEGGMLAFVTPDQPLSANTTYTSSFEGSSDTSDQVLEKTEISFTTAGDDKASDKSSGGIGDSTGGGDNTSFDRSAEQLPPLQAPKGVTALAGQTLQVNGKPLEHVKIEIAEEGASSNETRRSTLKHGSGDHEDDGSIFTDKTGRFLLMDVAPGHHVLNVYGQTARPHRPYGFFQIAVDIVAGETNVLPFTMFIPVLDMEHATRFSSPTQGEVVATTPLIPGLEVHIPAGDVLRWVDGKPLTSITITPIPMMEMPMPSPPGVETPVFFTIQADGALEEKSDGTVGPGIRIVYPNVDHLRPGFKVDFWTYDPKIPGGWMIYGQGTVTPDGKQIVPDPGVVIHRLTCAPFGQGSKPAVGPGCRDGIKCKGGEPVDLSTGLFVYDKTDLILNDVMPITFGRTYRQLDTLSHSFGIGTSHSFETYLWSDDVTGIHYLDVVFPDGGTFHYVCVSTDCSGGPATVLQNSTDPGPFYMSKIQAAATPYQGFTVYNLKLRDGTVYGFNGSNGRLWYIRDRVGNQLSITLDNNGAGKPIQITTPNGRFIQLTYDTSNRIIQAKDNIGRIVGYQYDANGRLWKVTDAKNGITEFGYDLTSNRMTTIKDPRLITYLTNHYDANFRVDLQTQVDTGTFRFVYTLDINGKVTQTDITDPRLNVRRMTFNANGQVLTDIRALGKPEQQTVTYTRQPGTNLVQNVVDGLNRRTSYTYDALGNVKTVTVMDGTTAAATTQFDYEPIFNQIAVITDPLLHATRFDYFPDGSLKTVTDALTHQTQFTNNTAGQPLTVTDPLMKVTRFGYDLGDLVTITDPLQRVTTRFLDGAGRLVSATNPLGKTTRFDYDPLDQIKVVTDPLGQQTTFDYDPNGNLLKVTDPLLHFTTYTYNNMDRLETRKDALQSLTSTENYQYDLAGNLIQFTDRNGLVTTYGYDALNRRNFAGFNTVLPGPVYDSTISYAYDAVDRLTQATDSLSGIITRAYNDVARTETETTPVGSLTRGYDAAGRRATMTVGGQPAITYGFDNANRLQQITQGTATVGIGYDNANRRTSVTLPNSIVMTSGYDDSSQLTSINYTQGAATLGNLAYGYDSAGRRNSVTGSYARTTLPGPLSSATYNNANQLTQWGAAVLAYDSNGNMTSDGTNTYVWNARNTLDSMNLAANSFVYDAFGRRATKTIGATTTNYLYDGVNAVQELDGSLTPLPKANLLTGLGVDEVFTRTTVAPDPEGVRNFVTDALGSTIGLTDSNGAFQITYTYDPFGTATVFGTATSSSYQYTGRENDGTGLYFYRARYYNPALQRFISEDPIGFRGGINVYRYVNNSPTVFTDPYGLWTGSITGTLSISYGPINFTHSGGIAIDTKGNIAIINTTGGGLNAGTPLKGSLGVSVSVSNASNVCGLGGPFNEVGGSAGLGPSVGVNGFGGLSNGERVLGMGITGGVGVGGGVTDNVTGTDVTPIAGRKPSC